MLDCVLQLSLDQNSEKWLQLHPRRSRRHSAQYITDLDYADDLALVSEHINDAELLLNALETAASLVGLHCNDKKTEYIASSLDPSPLTSLHGKIIKRVDDFKCLGSFIMGSYKNFKTRKALAWQACNAHDKVWRSNIDNNLKIKLFTAVIEPILLYGAETWTLTLKQQQRLDGTYTNLLRRVQNIHWPTNVTMIYGQLSPVSVRLTQWRLIFSGHCSRARGEPKSRLLLWSSRYHLVKSRKLTFPEMISRDTEIATQDLHLAMQNKNVWHAFVKGVLFEAKG